MTTYSPGSRRPKGASSAKPAGSRTAGSSSGARRAASAPPEPGGTGRRSEFIGIALVVVGLLVGLAIYLDLAGPLGRGVEEVLGWFAGLGRFIVPVVVVGIGVAFIRDHRSATPRRLVLGWLLIGLAVLGLLHAVRGPDKMFGGFGAFDSAGGWLGALLGQPTTALLGSAGAVVVFVALVVVGAVLVTGSSLASLAGRTRSGVGALAGPLGRLASRARRAVDDMSTLRSERGGDQAGTLGPALYDAAADGMWDDPEPTKPRRAAAKRSTAPLGPDGELVGEQAELALGPGAVRGQWTLPPASHLVRSQAQAVNAAEVEARGRALVELLASHGVETKLLGQTVGPTVTRYELELGSGVKVARVTSLNRDIAYAMAATDVRILAPIPGKTAIGVEVPNHTRHLVALGDVLGSTEARLATHPLEVAIGKDIAGRSVFLNLATTPHLLVAGATGAGKSSGINCIITSLLMRTTPDQVKLILIDPKQVEMGQYNRLPHLLTQPVTNPKKAANALAWAVREMERRYDVLYEVGFRDIIGYNAAYDRGELQGDQPTTVGADEVPVPKYERMPYIVVVVDELNDLMMVAARDVEESITRIAQKARAIGIHLIVATQRPSANVITGVIKANIPARMAFAVSSLVDSRVILDQSGAEKLVGKGDMLLLPGNTNVAQRIQGAFVGEDEVRKIVAHWRRQEPEPVYATGVEGDEDAAGGGLFAGGGAGGDDDDDEGLMRQAVELVVRSQLGSTSMLQRKLKVGFARAGRIMDLLEQRGIVGPSEGSKARAVLMTVEEYELLMQNGDQR
jgi:S-DNA-T family DNA segregation ATPase FtsK/SpoIIIE